MINWRKCSEELPKAGESFVAVTYRAEKILCFTFDPYIRQEVLEGKMKQFTHWAYASEFNFPNEERE